MAHPEMVGRGLVATI